MKSTCIISIFIFGLILLCCEKDNKTNSSEINDNETKSSEIIIGDYNDMVINFYDSTLKAEYHKSQYFNIDIDNNGLNDIQFESIFWGTGALGDHPNSWIRSLHQNALICGFHTNDTLFLHRDTAIYYNEDNSVDIRVDYIRTCHRIEKNDSIISITPSYKIKPLNFGEVIKISDTYKADTITIVDDPVQWPPALEERGDDTTIYSICYFYNDCNEFPLADIKYIGIKLENDSSLGWIKVKILDKRNILFLESGI